MYNSDIKSVIVYYIVDCDLLETEDYGLSFHLSGSTCNLRDTSEDSPVGCVLSRVYIDNLSIYESSHPTLTVLLH